MKILDHPNLVAICDIFEDSSTIYLAMKLCKGPGWRFGGERSKTRSAPGCTWLPFGCLMMFP